MNSCDQPSRDAIADALGGILKKRVKLWSENGELHYKAPRGELSAEEINKLKVLSNQIVAYLERQSANRQACMPLEVRQPMERVPLTFSQLQYWHSDRLCERPTMRSVATAVRVQGRMDTRLFQRGITEIVRRHEALRTRIVVVGGSPMQEIAQFGADELRVEDLTRLPEHLHATEVERLIHELILEQVYVDTGPLFAARLLRLCEDEHVLVLTMEHIISDGFSLNVLLQDVLTFYQQALQGEVQSLPDVPIQFADYAVWQSKTHDSWIKQHGAYWNQHLAACRRLRFPEEPHLASTQDSPWGVVPVRIEREMREALREWCRLRRTTLTMAVFTAFVALVLRSCSASEGVVRFQSDGRFSPLVERAIGYFSCVLHLRVDLDDRDTFVHLLRKVTSEYCVAVDHFDFSYVGAQLPRPEFTANSSFNWIPRVSVTSVGPNISRGPLACHPVKFSMPTVDMDGYEWDYEPSLILCDDGEVIEGKVIFSPKKQSTGRIEMFRDHLIVLIGELLRHSEQRVRHILLQ